MKTSKIQVGDLAIAVYASEGNGPAALFIHGNSSSGRTFHNQLDGAIGQKFRLVALDLPGHGASDRASANPATTYSLPGYAQVVSEVARQLNLTQAVIIGWSLGGHIALEAAKLLPRASGFVIYGTPPVGFPPAMDQAFLPHPSMASIFKPELTQQEISDWGAACLKPGTPVGSQFFEEVGQTDGQARLNLAGSIGAGQYEDEVAIVQNLDRPLAILHGEYEQLVNLPYLKSLAIPKLWRGAVQIIENAGHTPHQEQPERFNALIEAFIEEQAA
jgi:pimeloyl-ACP methyl ester carboxylesterase